MKQQQISVFSKRQEKSVLTFFILMRAQQLTQIEEELSESKKIFN